MLLQRVVSPRRAGLESCSTISAMSARTRPIPAFELIAEGYERRSLVVTCNQPFSEWNKIFPNAAMTVAAIDRLIHHATILEFNAESYRRWTADRGSTLRAG